MKNLYLMTDEELVQEYANGVNPAFDILLDRYKSLLMAYIRYMVRDREVTRDLFQETFVKAIYTIKKGNYSENGKFQSWLMQIAHNLLVDYLRRESFHRVIYDCDFSWDATNFKECSVGSAEDDFIRSQTHKNVRLMITYLPVKQREVVELRIYGEKSFKEIAVITGVSISTALARMRYAVQAIRKMLEKEEKRVYTA